ncbi:NAD(P)-binding domain-containing protein [Streptomyces sp. NPDC048290]|uniref:NADPH-dependent F420 reductase n=1 Tax=Streptomyces sp. NPDC048290 TaxID=3155811 RepID=UPI003435BC5F
MRTDTGTPLPPLRVGVLGTGNVARALAPGWIAAGHDVLLGSRTPAARKPEWGDLPVASLPDTAAHAEVLVNVTPGTESVTVLGGLDPADLSGKVLMDIAVGFTPEGRLSHLEESLGEEIQRTFPRLRVVKTFTTVDCAVMADPALLTGPSTQFLSGDDPDAKRVVARLMTDLGWPEEALLDLGGIGAAAGQEHVAYLFVAIARSLGDYRFSLRVVPPK